MQSIQICMQGPSYVSRGFRHVHKSLLNFPFRRPFICSAIFGEDFVTSGI